MILRPIAFCYEEHTIRIGGFEVFVQAPNEMCRINKPTNIQNDEVTQREAHEGGRSNRIAPILKRCIDGQQNVQEEVKHPVIPGGEWMYLNIILMIDKY